MNQTLERRIQDRTSTLQATVEQLQEFDRLKNAFVSIVSHELRTPLTTVKIFAGNLLEGLAGPLNEKQHYYVSRIQFNADQLTRMLNELLDLSKIEAGKWSFALLFCHSKSYLLISWNGFSRSHRRNRLRWK
ncbi:MAG: hypothetical protein KGO23_09785 [Nitrospirota bacterium]|nr:hypothetical protein [Nitrospirota bacterium]